MLEFFGWVYAVIATGFAVYFYALGVRHKLDTDLPIAQIKRGIDKPRRGPFAKPGAKKAPLVNDDVAAWQKENDMR